ncbi:helix-turn-helix domain-containing protein [Ktedonobacter racemifer]|uniref:Transcriptional regulator, XRE family n=1 Tax=Ktedonobacter racemifer DSM 44963 TaxID=485913 RepID=D6TR31_KTERA|nr:XRE family transcriptional regulator [Ktedonobacter racemifer]EFH85902.1 transcriptional regulator, XRE family [Ktedonobacter racemifer DSM 44963]
MEVPMPRLGSGLDLTDLGARIRSERLRRHLSLEVLSSQSGVSSSMLSDIERGKKVPSVLVLDSIATALGTSLARFLEEEQQAKVIVLRHREQEVVQDPSGWERRILSPVLPGIEFEFMRTTILPGVDAGVFLPHGTGSREYIAVEEGTLQLTLNGTVYLLQAGDSIYYTGDCHHAFTNLGEKPCTYYLVMEIPPSPVPHVHHR